MNCVLVRRGEKQFVYDLGNFWAQCIAQQILRTDEIFDWSTGRYLRADHSQMLNHTCLL